MQIKAEISDYKNGYSSIEKSQIRDGDDKGWRKVLNY